MNAKSFSLREYLSHHVNEDGSMFTKDTLDKLVGHAHKIQLFNPRVPVRELAPKLALPMIMKTICEEPRLTFPIPLDL